MKNRFLCVLIVCINNLYGQINYYQSLDEYTINYIPIEKVGLVKLGQGINLSSPISPKFALLSPFTKTKIPNLKEIKNQLHSSNIELINGSFNEDIQEEVLASSLYANFSARFLFASADAAMKQVKTEKNTSHTIQFVYDLKKSGDYFNASNIKWDDDDLKDLTANAFFETYGSHFISSVIYGFRIEILGTIFYSSKTDEEEFSLAMKAWLVKGSVNTKETQSLTKSNTRIMCSVSSGGLTPNTSAILNGFETIQDFLEKLKNNTCKIEPGPIGYTLKSYEYTLSTKTVNVNQIKIKDYYNYIDKLTSSFSKGIIIAWSPSQNDFDTTGTLIVPDGWALCDSSAHAKDFDIPNLSDAFLMGSNNREGLLNKKIVGDNKIKGDTKKVSVFTGKDANYLNNVNQIIVKGVSRNGQEDFSAGISGSGHYHQIDMEFIPKHFQVVYLYKLR